MIDWFNFYNYPEYRIREEYSATKDKYVCVAEYDTGFIFKKWKIIGFRDDLEEIVKVIMEHIRRYR